jgi:hypothetical protein
MLSVRLHRGKLCSDDRNKGRSRIRNVVHGIKNNRYGSGQDTDHTLKGSQNHISQDPDHTGTDDSLLALNGFLQSRILFLVCSLRLRHCFQLIHTDILFSVFSGTV